MLSETDVQALVSARHGDPFAVLGMHNDAQGGLWVRAMLPGAEAVTVVETRSGRRLAPLSLRHADGLWEGRVPRRRQRFDYRLQIRWALGEEARYGDAYSHGPQLSDDELYYLGEGSHLRPFESLGAHPMSVGEGKQDLVDGVRFAVWVPNASRVSVVGSFNAWDGRRHPMRLRHGAGVWEIFIPHAAVGDAYKYEIATCDGKLLPLKADPYARAAEMRPASASRVAPMPPPVRLPVGRAEANGRHAPISVYEVHLGFMAAPSRWQLPQLGRPGQPHCPTTLPTSVLPTSSCCPSPNTPSMVPGATRRWACMRRPRASGHRRDLRASWRPAVSGAWASCWTGCRRISRVMPSAWRSSTARPCSSMPTRARASTATGTP